MNKHQNLYAFLLITSFFMLSCATPRNPDGAIDVCALKNPPKDSKIERAGHIGKFLSYPASISESYSGCKKIWLTGYDYPATPFEVLGIIHFKNGFVWRVEAFDFDLNAKRTSNEKIICEFNENKTLTSGPSKFCLPYETWKKW